MLALATVIPVGLVLALLMFGSYGTHRPPAMTPGRVLPTLLLAVLLGPVATAALGLTGWLIGIVLLVGGILMAAMLRTPSVRH
ncbi:MAG: hypothetical protein QOF76_83 [Solirubrobacteraceae bacterium]|jgi:hypothetical protein|nr:hypothetical protein [Solirubrobacteraceae bacterium]